MIDLHLHTVFSDGKISDLKKVVDNCEIVSITDHNSVLAYEYFKEGNSETEYLIGCEVTVDRAPDYLVYFPKTAKLNEIENKLREIREAEENIIKACYYNLGYNNWENDLKNAFPTDQRIKNARTRDLAAIIYLYRTGMNYDNGNFEFEDLKIARKQRWTYADTIGNSVSENIAFDIANEFEGKVVLAHPIHTAIKRCPKNSTNATTIKEKLHSLLDDFIKNNGLYIEWEYFSEEHLGKYSISVEELEEIRSIVYSKSEEHNLSFTIGTDSHNLENYDKSLLWLKENEAKIYSKLADWIKRRDY